MEYSTFFDPMGNVIFPKLAGLDEADLSDNRGVFGTQPAGCRMNLLVARVARVTEVNSFCWHSG